MTFLLNVYMLVFLGFISVLLLRSFQRFPRNSRACFILISMSSLLAINGLFDHKDCTVYGCIKYTYYFFSLSV